MTHDGTKYPYGPVNKKKRQYVTIYDKIEKGTYANTYLSVLSPATEGGCRQSTRTPSQDKAYQRW